MTARGIGRRRVLPVIVAALGLVTGGCATQDVEPVNGGPPIGPVVAARPAEVQWANDLCTVLNPLFATLAPPPSATLPEYRHQVALARAALQNVSVAMHTVGPPPSADAQTVTAAIDERLETVGRHLAAAASQLGVTDPQSATPQAMEAARAALSGFHRAELTPLLASDLSLVNALVYAPACVQPKAAP